MSRPREFDHTLLGELIARRWQEDPGYYALNSRATGRWLEALWRAEDSGLEPDEPRLPRRHPAAQLNASG